ncbi:MAG: hypothetical protein KDA28_02370, partial [Phycisphaerales bacterium]|nr:hypothetical protein [Phycisphaerales bacterium]
MKPIILTLMLGLLVACGTRDSGDVPREDGGDDAATGDGGADEDGGDDVEDAGIRDGDTDEDDSGNDAADTGTGDTDTDRSD